MQSMADTTEHPYAPLFAGCIEPRRRMQGIEVEYLQLGAQGIGYLTFDERVRAIAEYRRRTDALMKEHAELRARIEETNH